MKTAKSAILKEALKPMWLICQPVPSEGMINDVEFAVKRCGGIEKAAIFLGISTKELECYIKIRHLPTDLAIKLGKKANVWIVYLQDQRYIEEDAKKIQALCDNGYDLSIAWPGLGCQCERHRKEAVGQEHYDWLRK